VTGCAAGEITPVNKSVASGEHYTVSMTKAATTRNEITKIENETGTGEETCQLKAKEGSGAYEEAAEAMQDEVFPKATTSEIQA